MKILPRLLKLNKNLVVPALLFVAAFAVCGCQSSFDTRATEKTALYNQLSPETRARLRKGHIRIGDSADMVYISWGAPLKVETRVGASAVWVYVLKVPDPNAVGTLITSPETGGYDVTNHVSPNNAMIVGGQEGTKEVTARVIFSADSVVSIE